MFSRFCLFVACLALALPSSAAVVALAFTELTGLTGGSPAETAVFKADLSDVGLSQLLSISILDNSGGLGGATGQFSGFDLDAIKLSSTDCATAACAQGLVGLAVFDFGAGTLFAPGVQRAPADAKLFGTGAGGNTVDNTVATLESFDANSTTAIPGADGFLSMGDNGKLIFNLTVPVDPAGLFLYLGEVGDNGEVAAGTIEVSDQIVPEPSTTWLFAGALAIGIGLLRRSRCH